MAVFRNPSNLTKFNTQNFGAPITHYTVDAGASLTNEIAPGEAVEAIVAVIATRGTVVALGSQLNGEFRVAVENSDWAAADLQTAIRALGATVGDNDYDATGATVASFTY